MIGTRSLTLIFGLALALPIAARAQEKDAKAVAQEILTKGSALFDAKDAAGLTATYTEDARVTWIDREEGGGDVRSSVKQGRGEVETLYQGIFKDVSEKTTSRNTVEFARFLAPDLLVIYGTFEPNIANAGKYPFIQIRTKRGDKWLVKDLQLFVISQD